MTETEFREWLQEAIMEYDAELASVSSDQVVSCMSFADEDILSSNEGVIVRFESGAEFQVTLVGRA